MSAEAVVVCEHIQKRYVTGNVVTQALRGIELEIGRGELFMLVGPSGCGKTTLLSVIAGILNQDSGTCTVLGKNLATMRDRDRTAFRGRSIGFVFQSFNLIPTLEVGENVSIPLLLHGVEREEAMRKAEQVLSFVGLSDKVKQFPQNLSGGQQQRVAIARSIVHDPEIIVCDEPTSALDWETGRSVMEIFGSMASDHRRTIIIVTHDSRILPYADRIATMSDGRIEKISTNTEKQR